VLTLDIADFFPSITWLQVREIFVRIGFPDMVPSLLADLCTRNKVFPQGAPTSPFLSNLVFFETDRALAEAARRFDMKYSRYADDLTFSSDKKPGNEALVVLESIIQSAGFKLQRSKTRLRGPSESREVTGLLVNEKVQPSRYTRRLLRAKFHNVSEGRTSEADVTPVLRGWASYVNSYDPAKGKEYLSIIKTRRSEIEKATDDLLP
jgi:RNA-directed DNA polymerase